MLGTVLLVAVRAYIRWMDQQKSWWQKTSFPNCIFRGEGVVLAGAYSDVGENRYGGVSDSPHQLVLISIPPYAQIALLLVSHESFEVAETAAVFADQDAGRFVNALVGHRLDELAHP